MGIEETTKPKLLITEDDFENRKFLEILLKRYFIIDNEISFQKDMCDSSESFYNLIGTKSYDIILMDISIKGRKNGLELTKEIKSDPIMKNIPIICYTAHAFNKDRLNALDAGCDLYLSKPADVQTLLNSLAELLKGKGIDFPSDNSSADITYN